MDNGKKVLDYMKNAGAVKSAQIAEATGVDAKEVGKIVKKLKDDGLVISPKNCFYELKK